jgi:hypothetical protein
MVFFRNVENEQMTFVVPALDDVLSVLAPFGIGEKGRGFHT